MRLIPKNWADFQHYKDRSPPWIKLHKKLLDDRTFQCLPVASKALAPMLWLLASESSDGSFDGSVEELSFRLRTPEGEIRDGLAPLIDKGFFSPVHGASDALAECLQGATPERETEAEAKTEAKGEKPPRKRSDPAPAIPCPDDVKDKTWADWLQLRKTKRAPVTDTVVDGARAEAEKAGMPLQRFLEIWCMRGSQGLQADWLRADERGGPSTEPAWRAEQRQRTQQAAPGVAAGRRATEFFDVEARPITPVLGVVR